MIKAKEKNIKTIVFVVIILILCVILSSCSFEFLQNSTQTDPNLNNTSKDTELQEFRLSTKICKTIFGVDSKDFYNTKGKNTLLENGYTKVELTEDDVLILHLTEAQVDSWRNSNVSLQILQKILGADKKIVSQIIAPTDPLYSIFYIDADTQCGFEISDDFSKIVAGPGDDKTYWLVIPPACLMMQVLQGKPSEEISVEYFEYNSEGDLTSHAFFPTYMFMFQNLDECKQLKSYEQNAIEIVEYLDPSADESYNGFGYESFWGMKYRSANLDFEIFAYEFMCIDDALKYCNNVPDFDRYAGKLPVEDSDKTILGFNSFGENNYQIVVMEGNKAYQLLSYNPSSYAIDKMLSEVFSRKA